VQPVFATKGQKRLSRLREDARRLLAWQEIEEELPGISVDETQRHQLTETSKNLNAICEKMYGGAIKTFFSSPRITR
jgi:hypothetical protein